MRLLIVVALVGACGAEAVVLDDAGESPVDTGVVTDTGVELDAGAPDTGMAMVDAGVDVPPTAQEVQAIVDVTCRPCHTGFRPSFGLNLDDFVAATVGVRSRKDPAFDLVVPGSAVDSYVIRKLTNTQTDGSSRMPPSNTPSRRPTPVEIETIRRFIDAL